MLRLMLFLYLLIPVSANAQEIKYLINAAAAPSQIVEDNTSAESFKGIISEVVKEMFANSPYEIIPEVLPVKRLKIKASTPEQGNWIGYGNQAWFDNSKNTIEFSSKRIYDQKEVLVSLKNANIDPKSINDVLGKSIITIFGFKYPSLNKYFDSTEDDTKIYREYSKTQKTCFEMLENGRGNFYITGHMRAVYYLKNSGRSLNYFRFSDFSYAVKSQPIYIIYNSNMDDMMKKFINTRIDELFADGKISKILKPYSYGSLD